jgi:hypothetical protein
MAFNIQEYVEPVAFGNAVYGVTGQLVDSAIAAGYAQWIKGITGTLPVIQSLDAKRVKIVFTPEQIPIMRQWLDQQVSGAFKSGVPSAVEYDLGSVLNMWAAKYAVPTVVGIMIAGFIAGYMVHKMRIF